MSTVIYSEVYTYLVKSILEHYIFVFRTPRGKNKSIDSNVYENNSECNQAQYDLFFSLMESIGKITKVVTKYGFNSILIITWYVAVVSPGRCV